MTKRRGNFFLGQLEILEDRCVPATFTVNTDVDIVADDGMLSLREALLAVQTGDLSTLDDGARAQVVNYDIAGETIFPDGSPEIVEFSDVPGEGFSASGSGITLDPALGALVVDGGVDGVVITARGLENNVTISSTGTHRVFDIQGATDVAIQNIDVTGGDATNGGGILVMLSSADAVFVLDSSSVFGNNASGLGGGLYHPGGTEGHGTVIILNSTFTDNTADFGAAVYNGDPSDVAALNTLFVANSTFYNNISGNAGSGALHIDADGGLFNNTIVGNIGAGLFVGDDMGDPNVFLGNLVLIGNSNSTDTVSQDVQVMGTAVSMGGNVINNVEDLGGAISFFSDLFVGHGDKLAGDNIGNAVDPNLFLGTFDLHGGPTETFELIDDPSNPLVDTGSKLTDIREELQEVVDEDEPLLQLLHNIPLLFDQRGLGFSRESGPSIDAGAFELDNVSPNVIHVDSTFINDDLLNLIFVLDEAGVMFIDPVKSGLILTDQVGNPIPGEQIDEEQILIVNDEGVNTTLFSLVINIANLDDGTYNVVGTVQDGSGNTTDLKLEFVLANDPGPVDPGEPGDPGDPPTSEDPDKTFVRGFLLRAFGELGTEAELEQFLETFQEDGREQLIDEVFATPKFQMHGLQALYEEFFGRDGETSGMQFWVQALQNGATFREVLAGFFRSDELVGGLDNAGIAQRIAALLDEAGDPTGVASELQSKLDGGLGLEEMIADFVTNHFQFAREVSGFFYKQFLDREFEASGLDFWAKSLTEGNVGIEELFEGFFRADEFDNIALEDGTL